MKLIIDILWLVATILIFISGIYFSLKLKFIHLNFKGMFKAIKEKPNKKLDTISSFKTLMMSLAGRIGTGSLAGIALAVYLGGSGVIFWIWIISLLCSVNTYVESFLAAIYKKKVSSNLYEGGPFYYIKDGLRKPKLAKIYAFLILISFIFGFLTIQVNTVSKAINMLVPINPYIIGIIFAILAGITIFGGVKSIANTTSKIIPFVTIFYLLTCLGIIVFNISYLPNVLKEIIESALNIKTFGIGTLSTLIIGMQKGIFSSEVGLGTGSIASSVSDASPNSSGLVQTLGIHIENLLIATATVLVIALSNYKNINIVDPNGVELTIYAFKYFLGNIGPLFITISLILLALSTIITGYYYGEASLNFLKKTNKTDIFILKIITLFLLFLGSVISSNYLWQMVDIMVGFLAIINIYAIFKLKNIVIKKDKRFKS